MKRVLEHCANMATVVACAVIVGHIAMTQYERYRNRPVPPYQPGDRIADTVELGLTKAKLTVLLGPTSNCPYCQKSMPFYERVRATASERGVRLVAFTNENLDQNRRFFEEHRISLDGIVSARQNKISLPATPTVILVRANGEVVGAWRGLLNAEQETRLLEMIGKV